jgi:diacylglycerol kinase family enzyme
MERVWFISNRASGSASAEKCEALEAVFEERGLALAGRTDFPNEAIPTAAELAVANADTVVLFAGDGTINATLCKLAEWDGGFLILPGGTMNLLAKALHASLDPAAIIHAAHEGGRRVALPFAEAGPHRAFAGLIVGPAAHWGRAREAAREGQTGRVLKLIGAAWRRTFGTGLRIAGVVGMTRRYQAVFVHPAEHALEVAAIDARDIRSIVELGWDWLTGDWIAARAVTYRRAQRIRLAARKPVLALFDGEPETLAPDTQISGGVTRPIFIATAPEVSA